MAHAGMEFQADWASAAAEPQKPVLLKPTSSPFRRPSVFFSRTKVTDLPHGVLAVDAALGTASPLYRVTSASCDYFAFRIPLLKAGFKRIANDARSVDANVLWGKSWPVTADGTPVKRSTDLVWQNARPVQRFQRINHFAGSHASMGCKAGMDRSLDTSAHVLRQRTVPGSGRLGDLASEMMELAPMTWRLPEQAAQLEQHLATPEGRAHRYIIKPARGSCGRGIRIADAADSVLRALSTCHDATAMRAILASASTAEVPNSGTPLLAPAAAREVVVQRYMENPLLIGGRKFDLRLYVGVTSFDPLVAYLHRDGLVRFAAAAYSADENQAAGSAGPPNGHRFAHLTNYSLGRRLEERRARELAEAQGLCPAGPEGDAEWEALRKGSEAHLLPSVNLDLKWDLQRLWTTIAELRGADAVPPLLRAIDRIIACMLASAGTTINRIARRRDDTMGGSANDTSFELLGFDIMIDANLRPWLVEVNTLPSLESSSNFDYDVKSNVVTDLLNLAQIPLFDRTPASFEQLQMLAPPAPPAWTSGLYFTDTEAWNAVGANGALGSRLTMAQDALDVQHRVEDEDLWRGGFRRICPAPECVDVIGATMPPTDPVNYRTRALLDALKLSVA